MADPPEKTIVIKTLEGELFKANIVQFLKETPPVLVFLEESEDSQQACLRELEIFLSRKSLREFKDCLAFPRAGIILIELSKEQKANVRFLVEKEFNTLEDLLN